MINVDVFSEEKNWSTKLKKKEVFFNKVCKAFPKKYKFLKKKVSLTLLLSNNKKIKKLNKNFRNKNKPTDILSFPSSKKIKIKKKTYIGDIIISYDFINKPKTQSKRIFEDRLIKIFIHGFLHLLNFDHKKNKDYKKMFKTEEQIYASVISKLN
ncbi:rRNA maturation RNase YbeY [Candidatus Pelagibacter sp.]|nr:rRNA maturation RNase YbeY [Candidatus Pelagibacter sp.]|tara:strand:+ start:2518 stop:2979 length:462 start_codon:yes stop_codon:yes gene_type:complete